MTDQVDQNQWMHKPVSALALARKERGDALDALLVLQTELDELIKSQFSEKLTAIKDAQARVENASVAVNMADDALRNLAAQWYSQTDDKHPHPAVGIRVKTVFYYDPDKALAHCIASDIPGALSLKKSAFEKVASVTKPDFVTVSQVVHATIASDLSPWLTQKEE